MLPAERLSRRLVRMPDGCLEWTGAVDRYGYGRIRVGDKTVGAHRLAWTLEHGPIPPGMDVLHHCDNPPCADAIDTEHHLFLGTHAENMADMTTKGRRAHSGNGNETKTHCPAKHPYSGANLYVNPTTGNRKCRTCKRERERVL